MGTKVKAEQSVFNIAEKILKGLLLSSVAFSALALSPNSTRAANECGVLPVSGIITCDGDGTPATDVNPYADGITYVVGVPITLNVNGAATTINTGINFGINITGQNIIANIANTVSITTTNGFATGMRFRDPTGGSVSVTSGADITTTNATGLLASVTAPAGVGAVDISVTGGTIIVGGDGISGIQGSQGGTSGGAVNITAAGSVFTTGTVAAAIRAGISATNSSAITIDVNGGLLSTTGLAANAVEADHVGLGNVNVSTLNSTISTTGNAGANGIRARITNANSSGAININHVGGTISTVGTVSEGIFAVHLGTGDINISTSGNPGGGTITSNSIGIRAQRQGVGAIVVNVATDVTVGGAIGQGINLAHTITGGTTDLTVSSTISSVTGISVSSIAGTTNTITLNAGANIIGSSRAIFSNVDDTSIIVNAGANITGAVDLGNGSDNLTFSGGDFSNVTSFMGGDDTSTADGFIDTISFAGSSGTVNGGLLSGWEHLVIRNGSTISFTGNALNLGGGVTTVSNGGNLNAGNVFTLTGDLVTSGTGVFDATGGGAGVYTINGNVTNAGTIAMSDGATGDVTTVNGNFTGGGTVSIDTVLNDGLVDTTDILHITGATDGTTRVVVNNVGGIGADTGNGAADGIQVIQVDGPSNGNFTLAGPVTIGAFNYGLLKADGQNWFLQTVALQNQVLAYTGLQMALQEGLNSYRQRLGERQAGKNTGGPTIAPVAYLFNPDGTESETGSGFWMKSVYSDVNATGSVSAGTTFAKPKFRTSKTLLQIGYDRNLNNLGFKNLVVGLFGQYKNVNQTIKDSTGSTLSTTKADGYGGGLTVTWLDPFGIYADFVGKITGFDVKVKDKANGASASPDVVSYSISTEIGYRFKMSETINLVPQGQLMLGNAIVDDFSDSAGIDVITKNATRVIGRLGLGVEFSLTNGLRESGLSGYGVANIIHNFSGKYKLTAAGTNVNSKISQTRFEGIIGAKLRVGTNTNLFGEFGITQSLTSNSYVGYKGMLGARVTF